MGRQRHHRQNRQHPHVINLPEMRTQHNIWMLRLWLFAITLTLRAASPFLIEPYLQLGDFPKQSSPETLALLWQSTGDTPNWMVEVNNNGATWNMLEPPTARVNPRPSTDRHYVWPPTLSWLQ